MDITIDGRASNWYRGTGIGNYTYQLINNINQVDFINKYTIYISKNSNLDLKLKKNFCLKHSDRKISNNFWEDIKSPNKINYANTNIYHIPQNGIGLDSDSDIPKVITLHDIIPLKLPKTVSENYLKIFNDQLPSILKNIDGIITVSNYSKEDIHKTLSFPKEKIFVTYLAAEEQYKPLNKKYCKAFLKENYNISDNYILYVGGFSPRKNILGLIEAFSTALPKLPSSTKLVVLGRKGNSYELYKSKVHELNLESKVIFPGFIPTDHMPIFYNSALMLVYPSFYEGFGLPPIEAMASGTPVISSNLTSIPEVVGDSSISVNPADIDEISKAIIELTSNTELRNSLIKSGLIQASKFNWKNTAFETINSYSSILNNLP
ncbi:glycosyltransferase family 4 protein [Clostridium mediterraneense]|uniref:glycosyltransferase family 4 protein n=1 Tax=Clostridium mediterraneense TaxID=1805472 RepID=UPI00082B5D15|nr:glycosyltransferase family 1 protein [Clostridium mediterraneense]